MLHVLIISAEPRLISALTDNFDLDQVELVTADSWETGRERLFIDRYHLVCLDYESLKLEELDTFITIDNILQKERSTAVMLVRAATERTRQLDDQLHSIEAVVDLSRGRRNFDRVVSQLFATALVRREEGLGEDAGISTDAFLAKEIDLPPLASGKIADTSLSRLIYTNIMRMETGVLHLSAGVASHRMGFQAGEPLFGGAFDTRDALLDVFAWMDGEYRFEQCEVPEQASSNGLQFIGEGVRRRVQQRALINDMMDVMHHYPVPTNFWQDRQDLFTDFGVLFALLKSCDGLSNWEQALASLGSLVNDGFRAAYLARQLDLIHTVERPGLRGIALQYSRDVREARQRVDEAEVQKTKAFRAASGEGRSELEKELTETLEKFRRNTPHEIFEIWEGCGRQVVQNRFYQLVKEHHPDVYGGNVSGDVRRLSQEIFILVKESYQALLKSEREQTVAPPPGYGAPKEKSDATSFVRTQPPQTPEEPLGDTPSESITSFSRTRSPDTDGKKRRPPMETPRRPVATTEPEPSQSEDSKERPADVRARIEALSGFKRRNRRKSTPGLSSLSSSPNLSPPAHTRRPEPQPPPTQLEEDSHTGEERRAKLDALLKKAKKVAIPNAPNPAKEHFNDGYRAFRNEEFREALTAMTKAHEREPENGLYLTFYGYTLFKNHPNRIDEAIKLMREAIDTEDRQALPDACLFMGHLLKAKGKDDEALRYYERALQLNPACHEADREIRLYNKRKKNRTKSDPGSFFKNLFKK